MAWPKTSAATLRPVAGIGDQTGASKQRMGAELQKLYSQELLNKLFRHRHTRIDYVPNYLTVSRQPAA